MYSAARITATHLSEDTATGTITAALLDHNNEETGQTVTLALTELDMAKPLLVMNRIREHLFAAWFSAVCAPLDTANLPDRRRAVMAALVGYEVR